MFAPGADLSWLGGPRVVSLEIHDFFASKFGLTVGGIGGKTHHRLLAN